MGVFRVSTITPAACTHLTAVAWKLDGASGKSSLVVTDSGAVQGPGPPTVLAPTENEYIVNLPCE